MDRKSKRSKSSKSSQKPEVPSAQKPHRGAVSEANYFKIGSTLRDRFIFMNMLGAGAFGQVFLANDLRDNMFVAIKTEKLDIKKKSLCMEVAVMRELGNSTHCPYIVACGKTDKCRYIVMELLGQSLLDVIKKTPNRMLPLPVVCQLTLQSITAVREVHEVGFIHRDVKPGNFSFGHHHAVRNNLFLYDFGLARIHLIDGKPRKQRRRPGFKGTLRYASVSSHKLRDLGRADDLIPIFYGCIEMYTGHLPWKGMSDRDKIQDLKENTPMEELCKYLPPEFVRMGKALYGAGYKSSPRYDKLSTLVSAILIKMKIDPSSRMDIHGLDPPLTGPNSVTPPQPSQVMAPTQYGSLYKPPGQ